MPTVELDKTNDRSIVDQVIELIEPLVQPYCDDLGNPCIELLEVKGQSCWPLRHKRVKTWIQAIYYRTQHKSISAYDLRNILNELEDRAWAEPSRIPFKDVAWKVLDRHAVGQSIIFLVSLCQSFEGYTKDLLAKLVSNGVIDRLKMAGMQRRFPLSMVAFADRVLEVKSCLQAIGIEISIEPISQQLIDTNEGAGDIYESIINSDGAFVPDHDTAITMEPCTSTFDSPTSLVTTQATTIVGRSGDCLVVAR